MSTKPSSLQLQQPKFRLGSRGEQLAIQYLQTQNIIVLARNVRWKHLEVDLIAVDQTNQELVFVEVKTRKSRLVPGYTAINRVKMRALYRFALAFVKATQSQRTFRLDAITIDSAGCQHFRNLSWFA